MVAHQGDIYWVDLGRPRGSEPGYLHPFVIVQNDLVNLSDIQTLIACQLTTNLHLERVTANVRLNKGEANLPKASVVNVTQIMTINKSDLREKIGTVPAHRLGQILRGIWLILQRSHVVDR